jgi:hypothetical protein
MIARDFQSCLAKTVDQVLDEFGIPPFPEFVARKRRGSPVSSSGTPGRHCFLHPVRRVARMLWQARSAGAKRRAC